MKKGKSYLPLPHTVNITFVTMLNTITMTISNRVICHWKHMHTIEYIPTEQNAVSINIFIISGMSNLFIDYPLITVAENFSIVFWSVNTFVLFTFIKHFQPCSIEYLLFCYTWKQPHKLLSRKRFPCSHFCFVEIKISTHNSFSLSRFEYRMILVNHLYEFFIPCHKACIKLCRNSSFKTFVAYKVVIPLNFILRNIHSIARVFC